jgi:hypothetical protein
MRDAIVFMGLALLSLVPMAQGQQRREAGHIDDPSAPDVAHFTATPLRVYDSLTDLYMDSDLVVQGEIGRVLPARDVSRSTRSHTLVTDLVLNVTMTFKGPAMSEVAIVQLGGKQGNRERIPDQYRMMRAGEHYILFLKQDPRSQSVALAGIPTYAVTGAWAGIFELVNNTLQLSPAANPSLRDRYQGKPRDVLLTDLGSLVR